MTKQIIINIEKCNPCPFVAYTREGVEGRKPCCNHPEIIKEKGDDSFKRIIPHKTSITSPSGMEVFHHWVKRIPKWCPLSDKIELPNSPKPYSQILKELDVDCDATEVDTY